LSETLWEALHEELIDPRSERVAELSEQLADVSIAVASLARVDARPPAPASPTATATVGGASDRSVAPESSVTPVQPGYMEPPPHSARAVHSTPSNEPAPQWKPSAEPDATRGPLSRAVLIDELAPAASEPLGVQSTPQIEIRDVRGEEGPAAWIGSIGRRLEHHEQDGSPFAVLLVELVDIERLQHAEPSDEEPRLTGQVEDALARELRPADSLTRERPGRYWLLAPQTDVTGAQMLVERIARAVRSSASHRGMALEVAVGVAVCPDDGRRASELAAHADVGLYAARVAGRSSIR
jgi:GGDEF domain-containing protein